MVRNSVGSDAYVADEIIRSRAGVRVRVGNTDAEGRMVMADLLCKAKVIRQTLRSTKVHNGMQGKENADWHSSGHVQSTLESSDMQRL